MKFFSFFLIFLLMGYAAIAEETLHAPPGCEFGIIFPDEPYTRQRCKPENPEDCDSITSFTKVFGIDATVNFNVSCASADEGMMEQFSGEVMKTTLAAMVNDQYLETIQTDFRTLPYAKQAIALGTGTKGNSDKIFAAQLWIGKKSVYTVEGELIGHQLDIADEMFANILTSIHHESEKPSDNQEEEKSSEQAENGAEKEKEKTP
jgi:hypothetical protein